MGRPLIKSIGTFVVGTVAIFVSLATSPVLGEAFRVENQVFVEDEETPRIESATIFYEDLVYDFLKMPEEITVFDRATGRIILLNPAKKIRTNLTVRDLKLLSERLRAWSASQPDKFLQFSASPQFEEEYDPSTGTLQLTSPWVTYKVTSKAPNRSEVLKLYLDFCDCYCLLNARLNPGTRPPFPRIELNHVLARLHRMPEEVELTVRPQGDRFLGEKMTARSIHRVVPRLVESDRKRVAQTDRYMATFQVLPFAEYQSRIQPEPE